MNIDSLVIQNFMTLQDEIRLRLNAQGLVLIEGINEQDTSATSNGAGKSSICDALCWGLWGLTAREETGDAVVNDQRKKDCIVAVGMSDEANEWLVTRHRKHKVHKNMTIVQHRTNNGMVAGPWKDISGATEKDTQAIIAKILGCSYEVFRSSIYAGQEDAPDLPKKTDKELKILIEEAAGVKHIEKAYRIQSRKLLTANSEIELAANEVTVAKNRLDESVKQIEFLKTKTAEFETSDVERREELKRAAAAIKAELVTYAANIKKIDAAGLKSRLDATTESVNSFKTAEAAYDAARRAIDFHNNEMRNAQSLYENARAEVMKTIEKAKNAAEHLKAPCPECGKPHTEDEIDAFRNRHKERAKTQAAELSKYQSIIEGLTAKTAGLQEAADAAKAAIPDVTALMAERTDIQNKLSEYSALVQAFKSKKDRMDETLKQSEEKAKNPYHEMMGAETVKRDKIAESIKALEQKHAQKIKSAEVIKASCEVLGPAGVRAHILDTVTPFLNAQTNEYLSILSDGNISAIWSTLGKTTKGELREKFNISVSKVNGAQTFKGLSGGEKRKVRLATMLALQDLVASRATKPIGLWIGDEIDDAVDPAGLERLMTVLERRASERGTVLVISHNDLKAWIDEVTVVKKDAEGVSSITGALVA